MAEVIVWRRDGNGNASWEDVRKAMQDRDGAPVIKLCYESEFNPLMPATASTVGCPTALPLAAMENTLTSQPVVPLIELRLYPGQCRSCRTAPGRSTDG